MGRIPGQGAGQDFLGLGRDQAACGFDHQGRQADQFVSGCPLATQIDQLAKIVDELQIDVFTFGILTRVIQPSSGGGPSNELREVQVDYVFLGGQLVHERPGAKPPEAQP